MDPGRTPRTDGDAPAFRARLRWLAAFGAAGPPVYIAAVALGGWLWPGYSQYAETVSTLTSQGAPNQAVVVPLFAAYNLALLALAIALSELVPLRGWGRAGPVFLGAAGVDGIVLFLFPQGPPSDPLAGAGVAHAAVAALGALCFLLAIGFVVPGFRRQPSWRALGTFSLLLLGWGIVVGGFGAVSVGAPYAGAAERASIGTFLLWTEVVALSVLYRTGRPRPADAPSATAPASLEAGRSTGS